MNNMHNSQHATSVKSLLVIVVLQLVVLQVQAVSMPSNVSHEPCSHHKMQSEMTGLTHSKSSEDECEHCEDANLDCNNGCDTSGIYTLNYVPEINLDNVHSFYILKENKSLLAVSQQPNLRPPR